MLIPRKDQIRADGLEGWEHQGGEVWVIADDEAGEGIRRFRGVGGDGFEALALNRCEGSVDAEAAAEEAAGDGLEGLGEGEVGAGPVGVDIEAADDDGAITNALEITFLEDAQRGS